MFSIISKDEKKRILKVSLLDNKQTTKIDIDAEELLGLDLSNAVKPGNLVNATVAKVLTNGIIVKFSKIFFGYIFLDYLE